MFKEPWESRTWHGLVVPDSERKTPCRNPVELRRPPHGPLRVPRIRPQVVTCRQGVVQKWREPNRQCSPGGKKPHRYEAYSSHLNRGIRPEGGFEQISLSEGRQPEDDVWR